MINNTPLTNSRYFYGESTVNHKGVNVKSSVGSDMDDFILKIDSTFDFRYGKIPVQHGNRPDLTSDVFFNTVKWWWLIQQMNGINDPFEEYNAGDIIKIPNL